MFRCEGEFMRGIGLSNLCHYSLGRVARPPEPFHYGFRTGRTPAPTPNVHSGSNPDIPDSTCLNSGQSTSGGQPAVRLTKRAAAFPGNFMEEHL